VPQGAANHGEPRPLVDEDELGFVGRAGRGPRQVERRRARRGARLAVIVVPGRMEQRDARLRPFGEPDRLAGRLQAPRGQRGAVRRELDAGEDALDVLHAAIVGVRGDSADALLCVARAVATAERRLARGHRPA
jgi:hypothetical protein